MYLAIFHLCLKTLHRNDEDFILKTELGKAFSLCNLHAIQQTAQSKQVGHWQDIRNVSCKEIIQQT